MHNPEINLKGLATLGVKNGLHVFDNATELTIFAMHVPHLGNA